MARTYQRELLNFDVVVEKAFTQTKEIYEVRY